jgi:hypothetical protein
MNGIEVDMVDVSSVDELDLIEYAPAPTVVPPTLVAHELEQALAGPSRTTSRSRSPLPIRLPAAAAPSASTASQQSSARVQSDAPLTRSSTSSLTPEPPLALTLALAPNLSRTALLYDDRMLLHREIYNDHPERPERIGDTYAKLEQRGFLKRLRRLPTREVTREEVLLVHSLDPWERVQELYRTSRVLIRASCPADRWLTLRARP